MRVELLPPNLTGKFAVLGYRTRHSSAIVIGCYEKSKDAEAALEGAKKAASFACLTLLRRTRRALHGSAIEWETVRFVVSFAGKKRGPGKRARRIGAQLRDMLDGRRS